MSGLRAMLRYELPVDGTDHVFRLASHPRRVEMSETRLDLVEFWAEGYPDDPGEGVVRRFRVYGTGHPLPEGARWWGTAARRFGLVWHLYELNETDVSEVSR